MDCTIDKAVVAAIKAAGIACYCDEADFDGIEQAPSAFAVYNLEVSEQRVKDGVCRLAGQLLLNIFSAESADGQSAKDKIKPTIESALSVAPYHKELTSEITYCNEGVWQFHLEYNVREEIN